MTEDLRSAERILLALRHTRICICGEWWDAWRLLDDPEWPGWIRYRLIEGDAVYRRERR